MAINADEEEANAANLSTSIEQQGADGVAVVRGNFDELWPALGSSYSGIRHVTCGIWSKSALRGIRSVLILSTAYPVVERMRLDDVAQAASGVMIGDLNATLLCLSLDVLLKPCDIENDPSRQPFAGVIAPCRCPAALVAARCGEHDGLRKA